jgi:hypothetical protein
VFRENAAVARFGALAQKVRKTKMLTQKSYVRSMRIVRWSRWISLEVTTMSVQSRVPVVRVSGFACQRYYSISILKISLCPKRFGLYTCPK